MQIVNFKNLKQTQFRFTKGTNSIIGENDSGKSNAMEALRILLDDSYYYSSKRLKASDFSYSLGDWRGHWIIISAVFEGINEEEQKREICGEISPEEEDENFIRKYIQSTDEGYGVITLFIRPQKRIRKKLFEAEGDDFNQIRKGISITDYEFYYTSRSQLDYTDSEIYKQLVGDIEEAEVTDPEEDDASLLGSKQNIIDVQEHISVVFIDALRDVAYEMNKPKNPIRRIVESVENSIIEKDQKAIKESIKRLNETISSVEQVSDIGRKISDKLIDMVGMVYSPQLLVESELEDDIRKLSRYLSMKPSNQNDINELGLGHLNMIYMALKMVEFGFNRGRELLNIMIIEEPEAHIHKHIQKTLFDNLQLTEEYTQIITTTHSAFLSESSEISKMTIMKTKGYESSALSPIIGLNEFGKDKLKLKGFELTDCIERYLDSKRSPLLFSKAILLVEGDGEELLIPNMVKKVFGISLDELGISIINVGSTSFEYIASLFHDDRIERHCAIITDLDKQIVSDKSSHYKKTAENRGDNRQKKLSRLYGDNKWVETFYAESTFETEFMKYNESYIKRIIENHYVDHKTIEKHKKNLDGTRQEKAETVMTVAQSIGKGWYAILLSNGIDYNVEIPDYIMEALVFACQEVVNIDVLLKIALNVLDGYDLGVKKTLVEQINKSNTMESKLTALHMFELNYPDDQYSSFLNILSSRIEWLGVDYE
jgi:predicted ATP-dependent endonuclease of OLD family